MTYSNVSVNFRDRLFGLVESSEISGLEIVGAVDHGLFGDLLEVLSAKISSAWSVWLDEGKSWEVGESLAGSEISNIFVVDVGQDSEGDSLDIRSSSFDVLNPGLVDSVWIVEEEKNWELFLVQPNEGLLTKVGNVWVFVRNDPLLEFEGFSWSTVNTGVMVVESSSENNIAGVFNGQTGFAGDGASETGGESDNFHVFVLLSDSLHQLFDWRVVSRGEVELEVSLSDIGG